jgi:ferredoxin
MEVLLYLFTCKREILFQAPSLIYVFTLKYIYWICFSTFLYVGACEGTLACSTCHVVLKPDDYARIPNKPCDEELDMLDLAYGLTDTSRLGCQITLTKQLDGLEIKVPAGLADARNV